MIGTAKPASGLYKLVPFGIAVALLFLSFLPVGIHDSMLTLGPQLLLCVVFYWAVRAPHMMPPASVFVLGIAIDLFSAGPLGFWALIYLATYALVSVIPYRFWRGGFVGCWMGFAIIAAVATALEWAFGSIFFGVLIPVKPLILGYLASAVIFAPLVLLFDFVCRLHALSKQRAAAGPLAY